MLNYLVTGANGFIGLPLCQNLLEKGKRVRGSVRNSSSQLALGVDSSVTGGIDGDTNWQSALAGIDCVIHLAGTVHRPDIQDPMVYKTTIPDATLALFKQAMAASVKRFIYVSTSHVYGIETSPTLITETCERNPQTPYGQAKKAAEDGVLALADKSNLELIIVRPPLVYGPRVGGNMAALMKLVGKFSLLPLGAAIQKRSFVGLDNFIAFLVLCSEHPQAANKVFNISDGHDLSTREVCEILAILMQKNLKWLAISPKMIHFLLRVLGRESLYAKLYEPMCLDVSQAKSVLDWRPPFSVKHQFQKALTG